MARTSTSEDCSTCSVTLPMIIRATKFLPCVDTTIRSDFKSFAVASISWATEASTGRTICSGRCRTDESIPEYLSALRAEYQQIGTDIAHGPGNAIKGGGLYYCRVAGHTIDILERLRQFVEERPGVGRIAINNTSRSVVINDMNQMNARSTLSGKQHRTTQGAVRAF